MVPSHVAVPYGGGGALKPSLPQDLGLALLRPLWIQTTDYEPSAQ
jgi:hypothetical protein